VTIQKKSLINSLNTTKKALVASSPASGSAATGKVKAARLQPATLKAGRPAPAALKPARPAPAALKLAKFAPARVALGKKF